MIKSKKLLRNQEDFSTLNEYRSFLISTLTCLQRQSPVFEEQDVFMPGEKPSVAENYKKRYVPVAKTRKSVQENQEQVMQDADEFLYRKFWLLNDSVCPSILDLGLRKHLDAERPNYYQRQSKNEELLQNVPLLLLNSSFERAILDEFFNSQECEEAICCPDEKMLLFPDTSKSEEFDDITTMRYLIKYKLNVGPLPFSADELELTQTQLDCLHAYIEACLIPWGRYISGVCLKSKILKLHTMYKNLVEGKGEKPNAQGLSTQVGKFMVDLLKKTWEQDQEAGTGVGGPPDVGQDRR